jgi:hypothetical protein
MSIESAAMAKSSAISHFGLFAAVQGGMFGSDASGLIPFIFAMPFLVHPLVFGIFGAAMEKDGLMPKMPVLVLSVIGLVGIAFRADLLLSYITCTFHLLNRKYLLTLSARRAQ